MQKIILAAIAVIATLVLVGSCAWPFTSSQKNSTENMDSIVVAWSPFEHSNTSGISLYTGPALQHVVSSTGLKRIFTSTCIGLLLNGTLAIS
jgi:hypothetical protein